MPPSKPAYNIDWIFSNNSDVHIANHRDWFVSYEPFATAFNAGLTFGAVPVLGIGDVELPTKTHPTRNGAAHQGTILLREVLYAPSVLRNILGNPLFHDHECSMSFEAGTKQSSLTAGDHYFIRANWPASERASWDAYQAGRARQTPVASMVEGNASPSLTKAERTWLKDNYGSEYQFLRSHGLSIYKDEDRNEGRRILRAFMEKDTEEDGDSLDSFERDLETDPTSHYADHYFSEAELNWIKAGFGHSANFLRSYGLKFYDDEDCKEGKSIARALMDDSDGQ